LRAIEILADKENPGSFVSEVQKILFEELA